MSMSELLPYTKYSSFPGLCKLQESQIVHLNMNEIGSPFPIVGEEDLSRNLEKQRSDIFCTPCGVANPCLCLHFSFIF